MLLVGHYYHALLPPVRQLFSVFSYSFLLVLVLCRVCSFTFFLVKLAKFLM